MISRRTTAKMSVPKRGQKGARGDHCIGRIDGKQVFAQRRLDLAPVKTFGPAVLLAGILLGAF
jgi:hypothetical protein